MKEFTIREGFNDKSVRNISTTVELSKEGFQMSYLGGRLYLMVALLI